MKKPYQILLGDSKLRLKEFPDNHFDSIVMDGPYGFRFMGQAWDTFDIEKNGKARDSYPVGKKRKEKGRNTTGFGLSIEAGKYNQSLIANRNFQEWFRTLGVEMIRVLKPGGYLLSFGGPRTFHRMISGLEDAGFEIRDCLGWVFGSGFPKSHNLEDEWEGFGTALKPAWEPICMARKPLEKGLTVAQNVKKWGTGALNIDACKIPGEPWRYGNQPKLNGARYEPGQLTPMERNADNLTGGQDGRWPANLLHDGHEDVVALFPESKGQLADVNGNEPSSTGDENTVAFGKFNRIASNPKRNDEGSAARFFYCAKTSKADRNEGLDRFIQSTTTDGRAKPIDNPFQRGKTERKNTHPTVKPTKLMRYLSKLVTPPGGQVLDPCCGSGSTGKGAILEGFTFTGIDMEQQWVEIADARCAHAAKVRNKLIRAGVQLSL